MHKEILSYNNLVFLEKYADARQLLESLLESSEMSNDNNRAFVYTQLVLMCNLQSNYSDCIYYIYRYYSREDSIASTGDLVAFLTATKEMDESDYKLIEYLLVALACNRKPDDIHELETFLAKKNTKNAKDLLIVIGSLAQPKNSAKEPKNWDKIVAEEELKAIKNKEYDVDPTMHMFQQIYENADDDTRRAMMKSYVESNGKALSTNWREVDKDDYGKKFADK